MLNRQMKGKISLSGLTGTANVKQVFPNVLDEIDFVGPSLGNFAVGVLLFVKKSVCAALLEIGRYQFDLN